MPLQRHLVYPATLAFHASSVKTPHFLSTMELRTVKAGNSQVLKALQVTFWFL